MLRIERAAGTFELANTRITVDADQQSVTLVSSRFEIADVPEVKQIKAAVGDGELFARGSERSPPFREIMEADDFTPKVQCVKCMASASRRGNREIESVDR